LPRTNIHDENDPNQNVTPTVVAAAALVLPPLPKKVTPKKRSSVLVRLIYSDRFSFKIISMLFCLAYFFICCY